MVENCRIYGGKLSYIWWKIVAFTQVVLLQYMYIAYSAHIIARITIVTLRTRFHFSDIGDTQCTARRGALSYIYNVLFVLQEYSNRSLRPE